MSSLIGLLAVVSLAAPADPAKGRFEYDPADETVQVAMIGHERCYDPHLVDTALGFTRGDTLWLTWLEFEPGKGDRIWVGQRLTAAAAYGQRWLGVRCLTPKPGMYKNPTLTVVPDGGFWLTYEQGQKEKWSVKALRIYGGPTPSRLPDTAKDYDRAPIINLQPRGPVVVGPGINHRVAADREGGAWVVWQTPRDGQFDVMAARLTEKGIADREIIGQVENANDWQPDVAVAPNGDVHVVWDAVAADTGFDVFTCAREDGKWQSRLGLVSAKDGFEARARVAADPEGRVWAAWEQGNANWGERYVSRMRKFNQEHLDITDANGPLHSFRKLQFGLLSQSGHESIEPDFPMPAMQKLAERPDAPEGVEYLGGYYERPEITIDGQGRPWVVYRHYYLPWVGVHKTTHVQEDWGVYARCFDGQEWSKLFRCNIGQGDGMQRLSVVPLEEGIAVTYTTGRTDRRPGTSKLGMAMARIRLPGKFKEMSGSELVAAGRPASSRAKPEATGEYQVYFGDLHRHTDLSLCYVATDGTMDDAYRFAIDVARLDFLGITDHARDIANNDAKSLLWWRCVKEVSRHDLSPTFIPMYAYEHSRSGEDHNVISLKPRLWSDKMPFSTLWEQMDDDSISIPHQTLCHDIPPSGEMPFGLAEKTWGYGDDKRRPLLEIYQGCRDRSIERDAHLGLGKGHIMGFIASSDHISTNASFAGVWAPEKSREAIFRAMQARRTFGATDRIRLKVTMGQHWMGEKIKISQLAPVSVEAQGTASIEAIELIVDGEVRQTVAQSGETVSTQIDLPEIPAEGIHYFYIRLRQADGNRAWSSPIWVSK